MRLYRIYFILNFFERLMRRFRARGFGITKTIISSPAKILSDMQAYESIKEDVIAKLQASLPEISVRFAIEKIGIFGSVARGEDTPESDVDVLYLFREDADTGLFQTAELVEYLETLFGRDVDFVSLKWMKPRLFAFVEPDMILFEAGGEATV